jgi:hypothetical protein
VIDTGREPAYQNPSQGWSTHLNVQSHVGNAEASVTHFELLQAIYAVQIIMPTKIERALILSSIVVNALSAGALAWSFAKDLPDTVKPIAVAAAGAASAYLIWHYVTASHGAVARKMLLGAVAVITVLGGALAWPNIGEAKATTNSKPGVATLASKLKAGIFRPAQNEQVGTCVAASGTGNVPKGYQIWVANLADANGQPDTSALWNLNHGNQGQGATRWTTELFGVGDLKDRGAHWVQVYLIPESASSALENRAPTENGKPVINLTAPIIGSALVDSIRVTRTGERTCPWDKK